MFSPVSLEKDIAHWHLMQGDGKGVTPLHQWNPGVMGLAGLSKQKLCSESGLLNQNLTTTGARTPFCIFKNVR